MADNLVIVESPEKAQTIQKYLGDGFKVLASKGHIRDLEDKKLSIDIKSGFKPEYVIPAKQKKTVEILKEAASKAKTVWLASDEDREGEAISWHLADVLNLNPEHTHRIVFHEITKSAIQNAVKNPRTIDLNLVNAQQARRVLDRLVGYELSPILWRKIQRGLSAGRVQSVALRLVVDREREIMAFESEAYYKVDAIFTINEVNIKGTLDTRFKSLEEARKYLEDISGDCFSVASVEKKEGSRSPAAPFTTSTLQQEAARKLHFPVSVTMRVAQSLYEHGLITYMRTDSTNLSSLAINTIKDFVTDNFGAEYSHPRQYKTKSKGAQEAHEAIRPTFVTNTGIEGSAQEQKLYSLIWNRTVASQMSEARLMNTDIRISCNKRSELFCAKASEILFDGFLKLNGGSHDDDDSNYEDENTFIPAINRGDSAAATSVEALCKYSQPPLRYTEGSLVRKLEELGIGRPSTYAPTISTLTKGRGYIVKGDKEGEKKEVTNLTLKGGAITESRKTETVGAEKGKLLPQEKGLIVVDYLNENFPDIMDYHFTADVEQDFDEIADGNKAWNRVISDFYSPFHQRVDRAMQDRQFNHVERNLGVDPSDGKPVIVKYGQYGPYVQKGEGEDKVFASLDKNQLIESISLDEALKLFDFPRKLGQYEGEDVTIFKGRFGPYVKIGGRNVSIPAGKNPLKITLDECRALYEAMNKKSPAEPLKSFEESGICIMSGMYGPYIKFGGKNFRIPKNTDIESLSEDDCKRIIGESKPTSRRGRFVRKKS